MIRVLCVSLLICLVSSVIGCSTGEIANLEQIQIEDVLRERDNIVVIFSLRDAYGRALVWVDTSIGVQGGGVLSESDLDTEVFLYSTKEGRQNKELYHGRLRDLHWNYVIVDNPRILTGEIPVALLESDPDRDSALGVIELTLKTPKQGNFFTRQEDVEIYDW